MKARPLLARGRVHGDGAARGRRRRARPRRPARAGVRGRRRGAPARALRLRDGCACTAAGRSCSTGTSPASPRSAERVRLPPPDAAECERLAELVVGACEEQDLALRLYWTGRALVATAAPIDPELEEQRSRGLRLASSPWSTGALAGAKSTSYAENMGAQDAAIAGGADDALLVGYDGTVLEAPTANVFWREGDRLLTPTLELPILAGVTRGLLLELAERETVEGVFPLGRLLEADEVFSVLVDPRGDAGRVGRRDDVRARARGARASSRRCAASPCRRDQSERSASASISTNQRGSRSPTTSPLVAGRVLRERLAVGAKHLRRVCRIR